MAGMFNQMKDLYRMQKEAREMQKRMQALKIVGLSKDEKVKITMDGTQEIQEIEIDDELMNVDNKRNLVRAFKEANKDAQHRLQKELSKDMDIDKLKQMLGG